MKKFTLSSVFILLSLTGHLLMVALLTYLHIDRYHEKSHPSQKKFVTDRRSIILKTYIENPLIIQSKNSEIAVINNQAATSQPAKKQPALQKPIKKFMPQTNKIDSDKTLPTHARLHKNTHHQIESILRVLIAEQQFYPEIAAARHQTGMVSIQFRLKKDGYVADMKILKSSGFTSLDAAAQQIIQNISPAKAALPFLKLDDEFVIDIIF